jgi:hypothetical protein
LSGEVNGVPRAARPVAAGGQQTSLAPLGDRAARVVYFPVRHHSPACAALVRELILEVRPEAVLIEGPADFNDRIGELYLPHKLPIAIYSYVQVRATAALEGDEAGGEPPPLRRGAYYPFCVYCPEWQALGAAREVGAEVRFIDLPWATITALASRFHKEPSTSSSGPGSAPKEPEHEHRYADGALRESPYVDQLCHELGVEGFDVLWDTLFELDTDLDPWSFMERCHAFCLHARLLDDRPRRSDLWRETYMAGEIRAARDEISGRLVVVTGGFHSYALHAAVDDRAPPDPPAGLPPVDPECVVASGIALTPYSYARLDSLTGYDAGVPNPGFYHRLWQDRRANRPLDHRHLLDRVVTDLRKRGQQASSADLIAVETMAQGLAALRGHAEVWRTDLVDGITGALVKEEMEGETHPMLAAIHAVLRGDVRGLLAAGTALPPLVHDLNAELVAHDLEPETTGREVELELDKPEDLSISRLLHRLRGLGIAGFERLAGSDLVQRDDLSRVWERWRVVWSPDLESTAIEAALYGPSVLDAAAARLEEQAAELARSPNMGERAARLLLDAALMGLGSEVLAELAALLARIIRSDGDFFTVTGALDHLLYLFRYDAALGTSGRGEYGALLSEAYTRGLWLLEGLGQPAGREQELEQGIALLVETFLRCAQSDRRTRRGTACAAPDLELGRDELVGVLSRVSQDPAQLPVARGAAIGALWSLSELAHQPVLAAMKQFARPEQLGDFLAGLFALAREEVQRQPALVGSLDTLLLGYSDEEFLAALPALRMAFTRFTPREKHHLALTLLEATGATGDAGREALTALEVPPQAAARVLAFEAALKRAVERFGLGPPPTSDGSSARSHQYD